MTNTKCFTASIKKATFIAALALTTSISSMATAGDTNTQFDVNEFHKPFTLNEITPKNMQSWPYYRHVSINWDEYSLFGTAQIKGSPSPADLTISDAQFDVRQDFGNGGTFIESLQATQTKGFLVMKDNVVLGEYYDNGFNVDQTQLLQSSSKTYAGIIASKLIDDGKLDPAATVASYLSDFEGSNIGKATIQHVLDMQAGLLPATDYHVPGGEAFEFETEQGLKPGAPGGHRKAIIGAKVQNEPGVEYNYNDKNTDLLAILAEEVSGQPFAELLSELFSDIGATSDGSISLTVDGSASPSYGISTTLRDYGLFHQWVAEGKAPESFYASYHDVAKDMLSETSKGKALSEALGQPVTYASQAWYLPESEIVFTTGSYGQLGFSDPNSGISVVFMQDWADNSEADKLVETVARALHVFDHYR